MSTQKGNSGPEHSGITSKGGIRSQLSESLAELATVAAELDAETQERIAEILESLTYFAARRVQADGKAQG